MRDEELREQLADLARPLQARPAPDLPVIRRRARKRRVRRAAAAVLTALAAGGVAAGLIVAGLTGAGHGQPPAGHPTAGQPAAGNTSRPQHTQPGPAGWQPAGRRPAAGAGVAAAPYFVTLDIRERGQPAVVSRFVAASRRQASVATVPPPMAGMTFSAVAAAGDDRTFVLDGQYYLNGSQVPTDRYYELLLGPDGNPLPLVTLRVRVPAGQSTGRAIALTPDGTELAVAAQTGHSHRTAIDVFSLPGGSVRTWRTPARSSVPSLSWGGDHTLLVLWFDSGWPARTPRDRSGMYLLNTAGPAGDFTKSRLLVSYFARFGQFSQLSPDDENGVVVTADGSAVFAAMSTSQGMDRQQALVEFSARTGAPLRLVSPVGAALELSGNFCGALWTDPSGHRLVADCGVLGQVDGGRFTRLFSSISQPGFLFAW